MEITFQVNLTWPVEPHVPVPVPDGVTVAHGKVPRVGVVPNVVDDTYNDPDPATAGPPPAANPTGSITPTHTAATARRTHDPALPATTTPQTDDFPLSGETSEHSAGPD